MSKLVKISAVLLLVALLLGGCAMRTVEDMYAPPRRSAEYEDLQRAMDEAMAGMEYAPPLNGEYRQSVQTADLNGDGSDEYLLFVKDTSDNPLKIMIFVRDVSGCHLWETVECRGAAFDTVDYVDLDGKAGLELVVGRQVSNLILRTVSVYSFADAQVRQLMAVNYSRIVHVDLDANGNNDLMIITRGESDEDNAVATLYSFEDGAMQRSGEARLSGSVDRIKRIMIGKLHGDVPAVYVAGNVNDSAITTDVFALRDGKFTNVSFSNENGTSVRTLRNYFVYADDIDSDGVLELPDLVDMKPVTQNPHTAGQCLIRWYAMDIMGREVHKMYTYHNFDSDWYLELDADLTSWLSVVQKDGNSIFYLWDDEFRNSEVLLTIEALTGTDRELAQNSEYRELHRAEGVVYAARVEERAEEYGFTAQLLKERFHLIQTDWKNGET